MGVLPPVNQVPESSCRWCPGAVGFWWRRGKRKRWIEVLLANVGFRGWIYRDKRKPVLISFWIEALYPPQEFIGMAIYRPFVHKINHFPKPTRHVSLFNGEISPPNCSGRRFGLFDPNEGISPKFSQKNYGFDFFGRNRWRFSEGLSSPF